MYTAMPILFYHVLFLTIPVIGLIIFAIFIKLTQSSFRRQGYKKPAGLNTSMCILLSLGFLGLYLSIVLVQSFFGNIGSFMFPTSLPSIIYRIASAVLYAFYTESIFRGYIFRNLTGSYGLFIPLYISSILFSVHQISINDISTITTDGIFMYIFNRIIPLLAMGLFLGFFFYKIRWSLIGPLTFRIGFLFLMEPIPLISANSPWWIALTFEMLAFAVLILLADSIIAEPRYRRKRYGLEA